MVAKTGSRFGLVVALLAAAVAFSASSPAPFGRALQNLTAVQEKCEETSECPDPSMIAIYRMDPCNMTAKLGSGNPNYPNRGLLLGTLIQRVEVSYDICECIITCEEGGDFVLELECDPPTLHEHYEAKTLRTSPGTRKDTLSLSGKPDAVEGRNVVESKFVHWTADGYEEILACIDPVTGEPEKDPETGKIKYKWYPGAGRVPVNGSLPYGWDHIQVGATSFRHIPPIGWDDDFGGQAETGGDHEITMNWVCCEEEEGFNSLTYECDP